MHDSVKVISSSEEQIPISSLNVGRKSSQYTYYDTWLEKKLPFTVCLIVVDLGTINASNYIIIYSI